MDNKRDNIYIYLWEEFNTIYVGRTINPKSRHYTHRHRESEKTYQFSDKHGVEHPKMVIIENNLSIKEGVEREKYWIEHYKNNTDYDVLNVTCGGQKGRQVKCISEEEKKKHRKEYYQKNREKILEDRKEYYNSHKEQYNKKYPKNYYDAHKEEILLRKKKYYENNKEKIKLRKKKYYEKNKLKRKNNIS